ncbi:MAG: chorismate synthase [Bacteroidia bacterium]|nr:MAG: chorismate synthase [Bacteroidia bacterium]
MGNTFGKVFRVTTFGESHGKGIGVVIDGCPANIPLDLDFIYSELQRRKPGQSKITTRREEIEAFDILSGFFEGKTTGAPLAFWIANQDAKSKDYEHLRTAYRPSHADFTYHQKYRHYDYRGGGRSSARETAARVIAGAVAKQILKLLNIQIFAWVSQVGRIQLPQNYEQIDFSKIETNAVRCPDEKIAMEMENEILKVKKNGDTVGGIVSAVILNAPIGLGEPVFDRLSADLAKAMLSINAAKGFEYGSGFEGVTMYGSEHNDIFYSENGNIKTRTNFSGGIQGGISNGMPIYFRVAFKPVATLLKPQKSIDHQGNEILLKGKGRHDPCVVPRAVPIVEAMASITMVDHLLRAKSYEFSC